MSYQLDCYLNAVFFNRSRLISCVTTNLSLIFSLKVVMHAGFPHFNYVRCNHQDVERVKDEVDSREREAQLFQHFHGQIPAIFPSCSSLSTGGERTCIAASFSPSPETFEGRAKADRLTSDTPIVICSKRVWDRGKGEGDLTECCKHSINTSLSTSSSQSTEMKTNRVLEPLKIVNRQIVFILGSLCIHLFATTRTNTRRGQSSTRARELCVWFYLKSLGYVQLEKRVSVKVKIRSTLSKRLRRRTRSMSLCYRMRAILLTLPARRSDDGDD